MVVVFQAQLLSNLRRRGPKSAQNNGKFKQLHDNMTTEKTTSAAAILSSRNYMYISTNM